MKKSVLAFVACMTLVANGATVEFKTIPEWLKLPEGRPALGNQHGDVAVSANGEVYVSVQDPQAGLQVYAPDGRFLRNVPDAPATSTASSSANNRTASSFFTFGRVHRFNRQ